MHPIRPAPKPADSAATTASDAASDLVSLTELDCTHDGMKSFLKRMAKVPVGEQPEDAGVVLLAYTLDPVFTLMSQDLQSASDLIQSLWDEIDGDSFSNDEKAILDHHFIEAMLAVHSRIICSLLVISDKSQQQKLTDLILRIVKNDRNAEVLVSDAPDDVKAVNIIADSYCKVARQYLHEKKVPTAIYISSTARFLQREAVLDVQYDANCRAIVCMLYEIEVNKKDGVYVLAFTICQKLIALMAYCEKDFSTILEAEPEEKEWFTKTQRQVETYYAQLEQAGKPTYAPTGEEIRSLHEINLRNTFVIAIKKDKVIFSVQKGYRGQSSYPLKTLKAQLASERALFDFELSSASLILSFPDKPTFAIFELSIESAIASTIKVLSSQKRRVRKVAPVEGSAAAASDDCASSEDGSVTADSCVRLSKPTREPVVVTSKPKVKKSAGVPKRAATKRSTTKLNRGAQRGQRPGTDHSAAKPNGGAQRGKRAAMKRPAIKSGAAHAKAMPKSPGVNLVGLEAGMTQDKYIPWEPSIPDLGWKPGMSCCHIFRIFDLYSGDGAFGAWVTLVSAHKTCEHHQSKLTPRVEWSMFTERVENANEGDWVKGLFGQNLVMF